MRLTKNFSLAELTASQTADRFGIDNTPTEAVIANLTLVAEGLEQIRKMTGGQPILISSGYRCPSVNNLIGGSKTSQHITGSAADITCPTFGDPKALMKLILASDIEYDQCILEFYQPATKTAGARGWVHVSFINTKPRMMALVIDGSGTRSFTA